MSEQTKIAWCDSTANFWIGCKKVSPGCANCYAEQSTPTRVARSKGFELWGGTKRQKSEGAFKIPAVCRFLSVEPMLGPVDLTCIPGPNGRKALFRGNGLDGGGFDSMGVDWVICGGESGPKARPFNVEWARSIVTQCKAADVACFVKQMGSNPLYRPYRCDGVGLFELGLKDKKGGDMAEWPCDLRVRQFPTPTESAMVK